MGSGESLHAVETVILLLLVLVAGFAVVARRLKVPYPIVLVLAGLVISFVPRIPRVPLDPNVVFVVFLPPLLYASAWTMSWREFRRNSVVIGLLAVGLVGFTVWGRGGVLRQVYYSLGLEGRIFAGSRGFDDRCDCGDVDSEEHRAAAEDRRHP
jgi:NhaP-type Na+/H+ or K+/H+ antiporter